jgi:hypothetical protein
VDKNNIANQDNLSFLYKRSVIRIHKCVASSNSRVDFRYNRAGKNCGFPQHISHSWADRAIKCCSWLQPIQGMLLSIEDQQYSIKK